MINLLLFGVNCSTGSGEEPNERTRRIAQNIFDGTGIRGGWLFTEGVPYVKDQTKIDEAKRLLDEEVMERMERIFAEMEKAGE